MLPWHASMGGDGAPRLAAAVAAEGRGASVHAFRVQGLGFRVQGSGFRV